MKLYHGTNLKFLKGVDLDKCPPDRDFGQGFYLTNIRKHAEERAQAKFDKQGGEINIIEYNFDWDAVIAANSTLKIKRFEGVNVEWALFIMHNRLQNKPKHEYDLVEGPVADDKMFRQFELFLSDNKGLQDFVKSLKYPPEDTHQIAFCTIPALRALFDYNEPPRYKIEAMVSELSVALMRDRGVSEVEAMYMVYNSNIFAQVLDKSTELYLKSWTEIYQILVQEFEVK
ncbi:hypothetical protein FACS1894201_08140 [Bacteroidia bacterium]|nr:hypothetical protein FACS1894201_08140 [Bacteroidia bacterium]